MSRLTTDAVLCQVPRREEFAVALMVPPKCGRGPRREEGRPGQHIFYRADVDRVCRVWKLLDADHYGGWECSFVLFFFANNGVTIHEGARSRQTRCDRAPPKHVGVPASAATLNCRFFGAEDHRALVEQTCPRMRKRAVSREHRQ